MNIAMLGLKKRTNLSRRSYLPEKFIVGMRREKKSKMCEEILGYDQYHHFIEIDFHKRSWNSKRGFRRFWIKIWRLWLVFNRRICPPNLANLKGQALGSFRFGSLIIITDWIIDDTIFLLLFRTTKSLSKILSQKLLSRLNSQ